MYIDTIYIETVHIGTVHIRTVFFEIRRVYTSAILS
jgi:hypothetical protein